VVVVWPRQNYHVGTPSAYRADDLLANFESRLQLPVVVIENFSVTEGFVDKGGCLLKAARR